MKYHVYIPGNYGGYYSGPCVIWGKYGGTSWVDDITRAYPLNKPEAERLAKSQGGVVKIA